MKTLIFILFIGALLCAFICYWNYCAHRNDLEDEIDLQPKKKEEEK